MAHNGSKTEDNGQTGTMNLHPAQLSSLTGKATVLLTIPVLFRSVRTEQFIQSKEIPETLAEQEHILLEVLLSTDRVFHNIRLLRDITKKMLLLCGQHLVHTIDFYICPIQLTFYKVVLAQFCSLMQ